MGLEDAEAFFESTGEARSVLVERKVEDLPLLRDAVHREEDENQEDDEEEEEDVDSIPISAAITDSLTEDLASK